MKPQVSVRDEINAVKADIAELFRSNQAQAQVVIAIANAADHIVKAYLAAIKKDEAKGS